MTMVVDNRIIGEVKCHLLNLRFESYKYAHACFRQIGHLFQLAYISKSKLTLITLNSLSMSVLTSSSDMYVSFLVSIAS